MIAEWARLDTLKTHAASPHPAAYPAKIRAMTASRAIHVLEPA